MGNTTLGILELANMHSTSS